MLRNLHSAFSASLLHLSHLKEIQMLSIHFQMRQHWSPQIKSHIYLQVSILLQQTPSEDQVVILPDLFYFLLKWLKYLMMIVLRGHRSMNLKAVQRFPDLLCHTREEHRELFCNGHHRLLCIFLDRLCPKSMLLQHRHPKATHF